MNEKQGELEGKQNRLIEIYKLHVQQANNISNRRTTTNRYYLLVMAGFTVIFTTFLQYREQLPPTLLEMVSVEWFIASIGVLGISVSWAWVMSINSYLRVNSRKYEALREMENKLEYKFFEREWNFLGDQEKGNTYWQRSIIELTLPGFFFLAFTGLMALGLRGLAHQAFYCFLAYPIILFKFFIAAILRWKEIEESFDQEEKTDDKVDR